MNPQPGQFDIVVFSGDNWRERTSLSVFDLDDELSGSPADRYCPYATKLGFFWTFDEIAARETVRLKPVINAEGR